MSTQTDKIREALKFSYKMLTLTSIVHKSVECGKAAKHCTDALAALAELERSPKVEGEQPTVTHLNMDPNALPETIQAVKEMVRAAYDYKPSERVTKASALTVDKVMNAVKRAGSQMAYGHINYDMIRTEVEALEGEQATDEDRPVAISNATCQEIMPLLPFRSIKDTYGRTQWAVDSDFIKLITAPVLARLDSFSQPKPTPEPDEH